MFSYYSPVRVKAFCKFAALALVLNFLLMAFLVRIMRIDIQRPELNDSLNRLYPRNAAVREVQRRRSRWNTIIPGDKGLAISIRIAGQIVVIGCFVIMLWHFLDVRLAFSSLWLNITSGTSLPFQTASCILLPLDMYQAKSPTACLQTQDHETAKEVIQAVKPYATSYIARVYKPLTFSTVVSDRTPNEFGIRPFLPAICDFTGNNMTLFLLSLIFTEAALVFITSYLLWNELPESENDNSHEDDPIITVHTLSKGHDLDIVHLAASKRSIVAAVGLDRKIQIWDVRLGLFSYSVHQMSSDIDPFPVLAIAIDNNAN